MHQGAQRAKVHGLHLGVADPGGGIAVDVLAFQAEPEGFGVRDLGKGLDQLRTEPVAFACQHFAQGVIAAEQNIGLVHQPAQRHDVHAVDQVDAVGAEFHLLRQVHGLQGRPVGVVVAHAVGQVRELRAAFQQRRAHGAVLLLVFPFQLRQPRMDLGLGNAAVVQHRSDEQIIQALRVPAQVFAALGGHVGHAFAVVDMGHADQIERVRQRVDRLVQIDVKARHGALPREGRTGVRPGLHDTPICGRTLAAVLNVQQCAQVCRAAQVVLPALCCSNSPKAAIGIGRPKK